MGCSTLRPDLEQKRLAESTEAEAESMLGGVGILCVCLKIFRKKKESKHFFGCMGVVQFLSNLYVYIYIYMVMM